ncbi:cysteine methyltransferase [Candidatus Saccharibacteria bacterium]|nr:cysteine methyltransferase [Candidatus Saccharibacteria bacterium]
MVDSNLRQKVEKLMSELPDGKVTTYGDLAAMAGHPYAAQVVGGIAHYGNPDLPWHRLVNRFGGLASGYCYHNGGREGQAEMLESEGISTTDHVVDKFEELRWRQNL